MNEYEKTFELDCDCKYHLKCIFAYFEEQTNGEFNLDKE
jgi:hypothetical protein